MASTPEHNNKVHRRVAQIKKHDENSAQRGSIEGVVRSSKTIQRPADTCRVIVTLEVKLSGEMMKAAKARSMYDATDVMRAVMSPYSQIASAAELIDEMRHDGELTVLSTKLEANK